MSAIIEIDELTPSDQEPLRKLVVPEIELTSSDQELPQKPVVAPTHLKPKLIFLSHSGAQKNFAEQLCEDLERSHYSPFFDKRPDSLPKGEVFAQYIIQAAQQCELAIVVVSEDYFSRSKWPMVELAAFVQSGRCKILPLFYGLSSKQLGDPERQERWFQTWEAWAGGDPRVRVEEWKLALRKLKEWNGLEYVEALGEVEFRKRVVATVGNMPQNLQNLQNQVPPYLPPFRVGGAWPKLLGPLITLKVIGIIILIVLPFVLFFVLFFKFVHV